MLSIIVPIFNMEKYLNQCIDSILAQTYTKYELILVDDGSVDRSSKMCDEYAEKDNRIHYFQVTASMMEEATFEREMKSLRNITDNYPKTVLTLDRFTTGNYEGIEVVNVVDWLLNQ